MHFDDDDFEFSAVEVTPEMEAGLLQAFRDAASDPAEHEGCPICAYLASMGQDVAHEHPEGEKPLFAWVNPELDAKVKRASPRRVERKTPPLTRAQRRRFRKRLR